MFVLSTLEDNVRIAPQDLGKSAEAAVTAVLERTFVDRVVPDLGLILTIYDLLEIDGGFVYHSDGGAHYRVRFRVVVFCPFRGELIVGRIARMDKSGVHVSLGFFEDVLIPDVFLPESSFYKEDEKVWVWRMDGHELYFERDMPIRFRVQWVKFPAAPTLLDQQEQREKGEPVLGTKQKPYVPMEVTGKADGDGLGMVHWFEPGGGEEDVPMEEEEEQ